ncbi:hypothetical protein NDU88_000245 [Pleurodeles waltl]|uniref:Uncharacterized protein n=1 Tax=Pleurodeles waltl TaxID=8319 RepID=A0AAV7S8Z3_PLEWA|nr:hypothetical protein NDU88_000245 [Pleurodeles waltl]
MQFVTRCLTRNFGDEGLAQPRSALDPVPAACRRGSCFCHLLRFLLPVAVIYTGLQPVAQASKAFISWLTLQRVLLSGSNGRFESRRSNLVTPTLHFLVAPAACAYLWQ